MVTIKATTSVLCLLVCNLSDVNDNQMNNNELCGCFDYQTVGCSVISASSIVDWTRLFSLACMQMYSIGADDVLRIERLQFVATRTIDPSSI